MTTAPDTLWCIMRRHAMSDERNVATLGMPGLFFHPDTLQFFATRKVKQQHIIMEPLQLSALPPKYDGAAAVVKHLNALRTASMCTVAAVHDPKKCPATTYQPPSHWIVHIGLGGFHRAHLAVYTDEANQQVDGTAANSRLKAAGGTTWGILGVSLRDQDASLINALTSQHGRYTVVERQGKEEQVRVVSSISATLLASDALRASELLSHIASPSTHIVSLTVTPGGYFFTSDKTLDLRHELVVADASHVASVIRSGYFRNTPSAPISVSVPGSFCRTPVGVIAHGLLHRFHRLASSGDVGGHVTIMSCDNIQDNGHLLQAAVASFVAKVAQLTKESGAALLSKFVAWMDTCCFFPCSMVDRITPVATTADAQYVKDTFRIVDKCPVVCERFRQWVVEVAPTSADGRVLFQQPAGWASLENVQFVKVVAPYETMKLRLLNGSHLAVACLGELMGLTYIHETMQCTPLRALMEQLMDRETGPTVPSVPGIDLAQYKATLIQRFANGAILDTVDRVATDAPLPVLIAALQDRVRVLGSDTERMSPLLVLSIAAWVLRTSGGTGQTGRSIHVRHPLKDQLATLSSQCRDDLGPLAALLGSVFGGEASTAQGEARQVSLMQRPQFVAAVTDAWRQLKAAIPSRGVEAVIVAYLAKSASASNVPLQAKL